MSLHLRQTRTVSAHSSEHDYPHPSSSLAVDWADFPIIDLSKAKTQEGRAELAPVVRDAMGTYGFLYVVNHGLTQAQIRRPLSI